MLRAWQSLDGVPLRIRGGGQLQPLVDRAVEEGSEIDAGPYLPPFDDAAGQLQQLYRGARFLLWPSEGYFETFGLVAAEAYSCGTPVIASRTGVMPEIVRDGETGLLFEAGNADDLASKVRWAWDHPSAMRTLGENARTRYEESYTAEANYARLMEIYSRAITRARA
jgi:glycosyltransferase involved in cell wall biosynthesis